jgi:hypothetical protein
MRIISKTHDYYDGVMKQAMDRTVVFSRNMEKDIPVPWTKTMGTICRIGERETGCESDFSIEPILVFFCGKVVPLVSVSLWDRTYGMSEPVYVYDMAAVPRKLSSKALPFIELWLKLRVCNHWIVWETDPNTAHYLKKYGSVQDKKHRKPQFVANDATLTEYALKNGVAYFLVRFDHRFDKGNVITHYPVLKDIEFFKVVTPFDAFQQVQMYLTNELAREKQMPMKPISDKLKAQSHGYNEWSFRKEPTKTRSKR